MLFAWITDPNAWLALGTLTLLEIVLGIDNIIFLSLVVAKLPTAQRAHAQKQQQHKEKAGRRCTNRHTAQINRTIKMTNNRRIDQPKQRDGDIGENHG